MQQQALATGRPLISTRYGGVATFFVPEAGYVINYRMRAAAGKFRGAGEWAEPNADGVIDAMRRVYTHRQEAKKKGEAGSQAVAKFSWASSNQRLAKVLEEAGFLSPGPYQALALPT
jgi:glycosyltransferase involved in cell wall biosynthesis